VAEVRGRRVHIGVQLQGQRATWSEYAAAIRRAEDAGVGSIWAFDHLLPFAGADDGACLETLTTLGALAVLTSRARIGVLVNGVLYRDPATLAKAAAQVDQMTGGRLEFSLGAAWAEAEFRVYGLPFPSIAERLARLEEALEVVGLLWGQPRSTFAGRYYQLHDAPCEPKPYQQPHPPITVGGMGRRTLRVAARFADRLNVVGSVEQCEMALARLGDACAAIGRDCGEIELSAHPQLALAAGAEEAEQLARRVAANLGGTLGVDRAGWVIGTPDEVIAELGRYFAVGVSHFVLALGHPFDDGQLELLRDEVLPALA
jgi:F420-dependent oxidoreductase-like protein